MSEHSAEATVAARALRDAADEIDETQPDIGFRAVAWLHARADEIEAAS